MISTVGMSSRVMYVTCQLNKRYDIKVVKIYTSTSDSDEESVHFCEGIKIAMNQEKIVYIFLIGDSSRLGKVWTCIEQQCEPKETKDSLDS